MRDIEHAGDIGIEHTLHILVGEQPQEVITDDSGVVDQHVDAIPARDGALHRGCASCAIPDVGLLGRDFLAGRARGFDHFTSRVAVLLIEEHDVRAFLREQLDDRAPDAATAPGDQHPFARNAWTHQ